MRIVYLIAFILSFLSCNYNSKNNIDKAKISKLDYLALSLEYETITKLNNWTPIDEKIYTSNNLYFTNCLEELLNHKILLLIDSSMKNINGVSYSKSEYVNEREEWENKIQLNADSIRNACGTFYYCEIESWEYLIKVYRERIRKWQHFYFENI